MPRVLRRNLPGQLYAHLLERVQQRHISGKQLTLMVDWLDTQPEVPRGKWFKRFPGVDYGNYLGPLFPLGPVRSMYRFRHSARENFPRWLASSDSTSHHSRGTCQAGSFAIRNCLSASPLTSVLTDRQ